MSCVIDYKQELDTLISKGTFEYNPRITELIQMINDEQINCQHQYENGICLNCLKNKEDK